MGTSKSFVVDSSPPTSGQILISLGRDAYSSVNPGDVIVRYEGAFSGKWTKIIAYSKHKCNFHFTYMYLPFIQFYVHDNRVDLLCCRAEGFEDPESGVKKRMIGLGTTPTTDDVYPFTVLVHDVMTLAATGMLSDGGLYYVNLKVRS